MPGSEIEEFIARWSPSDGGERSNYQIFPTKLCELLDVPKPDPAIADDSENAYVYDRAIPRQEADAPNRHNSVGVDDLSV